MKKIYSEPKMLTVESVIETELLIMSLDDENPTDGLEEGTKPGKDGDGKDGEWGGAKGRNAWSDGGLW